MLEKESNKPKENIINPYKGVSTNLSANFRVTIMQPGQLTVEQKKKKFFKFQQRYLGAVVQQIIHGDVTHRMYENYCGVYFSDARFETAFQSYSPETTVRLLNDLNRIMAEYQAPHINQIIMSPVVIKR